METIGERIGKLMEEQRFSYNKLSEKTGIPAPTIQRYRVGKTKNMSTDKLDKIAEALGVSSHYLRTGEINTEYSEDMDMPAKFFAGRIITEQPSPSWNYVVTSSVLTMEMNRAFSKLNNRGKQEALKRIKEMTKLEEYSEQDVPQADEGAENESNNAE